MNKFSPGFRLSVYDVAILIGGGLLAWYAMRFPEFISAGVVFVVLHFFLFCNVLRMSRRPEMIWAATFAGLSVLSLKFDLMPFHCVLVACALLTAFLTVLELRKPSYHGIFWASINPNLESWFNSENKN